MSKPTGKIDIEQMLGTLRYHPEIWDQPLLLQMSLGDLSKVLDKSLSRRRVLDTYLRWLEAHRLHPNHNSKYWEPLLVEWSQSLRNRGFEKDELIRDVKKWKEDNGPFPSSLRRCTLMPFDIAKAFPEYREPWSTKQDYSGKPPGDYVCNRCDTPGEHFSFKNSWHAMNWHTVQKSGRTVVSSPNPANIGTRTLPRSLPYQYGSFFRQSPRP
jgi:hypothetical protein